MTVTSETNKAQATGNGVVKAFAYTFQVPELEWLEVYLNDVLQTSGYTVSGIGAPTGGAVTFTVAPAAGVTVTLLRVVPLTQEVDYQPYDPFPAEVAEGTLDKLTMITQQMQEELDRSWKVPIDTPPTADVSPPPYEAGKVIGWSETDQTQLVNYPGIGTFIDLVDDAEAAAAAAAASEGNAQAYATSAQNSATIASDSANAAANSAAAAQVAKLEWQGTWNSSQNYNANDVVEYSGSSYVALTGNTNVTPVAGATWDLVALKGAKGDPGTSGSGTGNVVGPATSTPNGIALFNTTDGTLLKDGPLISDLATDAELSSGLAGKANTVHTHTLSQVTDAGNAASRTVQTSPADATAGRVLLVGAGAAALGSDVATDAELATKASLNSTPTFLNELQTFIAANVTGTYAVDPTLAGDLLLTMTGNTTISFTTSGVPNNTSIVVNVQVAGAFIPTFTGVTWPGGAVPTYAANNLYTFNVRNNNGVVKIMGTLAGVFA